MARSARSIAVALALLLPALAPTPAAADADPASDVLLGASVFYPYSPAVSRPLQSALNRETAAAKRAGFPIKVALIGHPLDLGGIPEFFNRPRPYARFLDTEISFHTLQPVLVIMAAGLGGSGLGPPATATLSTLQRPPSDDPDALAQTAITDVAKLANAAGHPIPGDPGAVAATGGGGPSTPLLIAVGVALAVGLGLGLTLALVRMRARRQPG